VTARGVIARQTLFLSNCDNVTFLCQFSDRRRVKTPPAPGPGGVRQDGFVPERGHERELLSAEVVGVLSSLRTVATEGAGLEIGRFCGDFENASRSTAALPKQRRAGASGVRRAATGAARGAGGYSRLAVREEMRAGGHS